MSETANVKKSASRWMPWLLPVLVTIALTLGGWSMGWLMGTETRVVRLEEWRCGRASHDEAVLERLREIQADLKNHIRYHMTGGTTP